jgi:hypothetical protein
MRQAERQQLIELGILTPDCDPRITTSQKVSPERKRQTMGEGEGSYVWSFSDQDLGAPKRA